MYGYAYSFLPMILLDGYDSEDAYSSASDTGRKKSGMSDKTKDRISSVGDSLRDMGKDDSDRAAAISQNIRPVSYKHGGRVKKTGLAHLHRGELVVPRNKVKRVKKAMRKTGRKGSGRA